MLRNLFLLSLTLIVFAGCNKDDDEPAEPTKKQLLTNSAWKLSNVGIDANGDGTIDTALPDGTIEDCDKDNTFLFKDDETGTIDEGPTKCDPQNPQTVPFEYSTNADVSVINFPDSLLGGISGDVNVLKLNATNMTLSKSVEIGLPIEVNVVVELTH